MHSRCRRFDRSCRRSCCRRSDGPLAINRDHSNLSPLRLLPFRLVGGDQPWPHLPASLVLQLNTCHGDGTFTRQTGVCRCVGIRPALIGLIVLNKIDKKDSKIDFEMSFIVVEAIRGRCASFMILTATVSEICGGQTNVSIIVVQMAVTGDSPQLMRDAASFKSRPSFRKWQCKLISRGRLRASYKIVKLLMLEYFGFQSCNN